MLIIQIGWILSVFYSSEGTLHFFEITNYYYMFYFGDFGDGDPGDFGGSVILWYSGTVVFGLILVNILLAIIVNGWDDANSRKDLIDLFEQNEIIMDIESIRWLFRRNQQKSVYIIFAKYVNETN
jgi:hypothetical protein